MLFLRSWLEDYIDLSSISNDELAKKITAFSMEVEEIKEIQDYYHGLLVIGRIEDPIPVEGSDKLKLFKVNLGDRHIQIVSAAPNVKDQMLVGVALNGAKLPHDFTIVERKMMGHISQGMCIGKSELCLEEGYSSGLWEIEADLKMQNANFKIEDILGRPLPEVLPQFFPKETIFDIKVLPNSMGILSNHLGLAYELALIYKDKSMLKPQAQLFLDFDATVQKAKESITLDIDQSKLSFKDNANYSNYFTLHSLSLPKSFDLSALIAHRMFLIEQNSVSALVDISNYLIFDIGQPTHFFSKIKLEELISSPKIDLSVNQLNKEVRFEGLGHLKGVALKPENVAIEANTNPIILPGISGGVSTMIDKNDTEFYLEIANFDMEMVAKNSFLLGFSRSQATRVFAGGVPAQKILLTLVRLKQILGENIDIRSLLFSTKSNNNSSFDEFIQSLKSKWDDSLVLDLKNLSNRIDANNRVDQIVNTLQHLGEVSVIERDSVTFKPNKLYTAYQVTEDILADLARLNDLNLIQSQSLNVDVLPVIDKIYKPFLELKKVVASLGFTETLNRPFISAEILKNLTETSDQSLLILNPIRSQEPFNRTGLVESLLQITKKNLDSGSSNVNVFELNKIYLKNKDNQELGIHKITESIQEKLLLGILTTQLNMQDLTSVMHKILQRFNIVFDKFTKLENSLVLNGFEAKNSEISVKIFQFNNSTKKKFALPLSKNINYLEFDLTNWKRSFNSFDSYVEDKEYPDLKRSLSFFVPKNITFKEIKESILNLPELQTNNFDIQVEGVERIETEDENTNILNLGIKLNHPSRTITGQEAESFEISILKSLNTDLSQLIVRR